MDYEECLGELEWDFCEAVFEALKKAAADS